MGVPTSEVGYTSAMPRREDHEVHKRTCGGIGGKKLKIGQKFQTSFKSDLKTDTFHEDLCAFMILPCIFLGMIHVLDKSVEKIKTHFLSITFFRISCRLWESVEKYCRSEEATEDNMAHMHCMLDTQGYKYTLRIYNTYCFCKQSQLQERALDC